MVKGSGLRAACGALFAALLLSACQSTPVVNELRDTSGILRYVPADTPYVFTSGAPLPDATLDALEPKFDRMLTAYRAFMRETLRESLSENEDGLAGDERAAYEALVNEIIDLLSLQAMREAGIPRGARTVIYGNGILPVLRFEVSDEAAFDAVIARVETAAGESMPVGTLDGRSYRYFGDDGGRLIIGTFDGTAVVTFAPAGFGDEHLRQLLGLVPPAQNLAMAGTLQAIADGYGYTDHYIGYVDVVRVVRTFAEPATGLDGVLLKGLGESFADVPPACREEMIEIAGAMPRLVVGYEKVTADEMISEIVVELRPDIATSLATVPAGVAGVGSDLGGLFSLGMGVNVEAMLNFYRERLDAMIADPWECEALADAQASATEARALLDRPMPPFAYAFRGFNLIVDDIVGLDLESDAPPESIDASAVIALEDAPTMFSMFSMMSPDLASLNLQPDGKPVPVDNPQLREIAAAAYAAMLQNGVAISVGADSKRRVVDVLSAPAPATPPFIGITMDATRYYQFLGDAMMLTDDDAETEEMPLAAREALRDAMLVFADVYDRMSFDVRFTPNGIAVGTRVTMAD